MSAFVRRLEEVRDRIAGACARSGRDPAAVRIVAVSKTHPAEAVLEAVAAGVDAIGENRVQEAAAKRGAVPGPTPWHMVGPLQRNKARQALELFDVLESLDRIVLADRLETLLDGGERVLPVFVEVNVGGEAQKSGVQPDGVAVLAEHVLRNCPHLRLTGLMTVPPYDPDPERSRRHFSALRELSLRLAGKLSLEPFQLSMGMSEDFPVAVEEGADWVRLGRVLFGARLSRP